MQSYENEDQHSYPDSPDNIRLCRYFGFQMDQREIPIVEKVKNHESYSLMLDPLAAANPTVFQRKHQMTFILYTNSYPNFYQTTN